MATGQTLVIGAVIFASVLLLASFPSGPDITGQNSNNRAFANNALQKTIDTFNREIAVDRSSKHLVRESYSYHRFVERLASSKGQKYSAYQLVVLPELEEAFFINYQGRDSNLTLDLGDEQFNSTVEESQFQKFSYDKEGVATIATLKLRNYDRAYNFSAASPRTMVWMRFEANDETWVNSVIG